MTDEDLARDLNIPVELVPKIEPAKRAAYERLIGIADELVLWQHGVGPRPRDVIICHEHRPHRRRANPEGT